MITHTVTFQVPENLYLRLKQAAQATKQSFDDVVLHAMQVGSPPAWDDVPSEFQADVAALDRRDDSALWRILRQKMGHTEAEKYQELLDKNAEGTLSREEARALEGLRFGADRLMLQKAQAAALLRWRGHRVPSSEKLLSK